MVLFNTRFVLPLAVVAAAGLYSSTASAQHVGDAMDEAATYPQQDFSDMFCLPVIGRFGAMSVPVPPCESAVGLCTAGELRGVLRGQYELEVEQLMSTNDPRVPFVNFFTGTSEIETQFGDFVAVDTGALNLSAPGTTGSGRIGTLLTIVEGGAGFINIQGTLDLTTGEVGGRYSGLVCWDWDDPDHGWGCGW